MPYYIQEARQQARGWFSKPPHGVMLMANGISEFIKQKEKRGCYCARCLCTRNIKAAEREIKGDIARKKMAGRRLKQRAGNQVRQQKGDGFILPRAMAQ